jgi:hypothetical protein
MGAMLNLCGWMDGWVDRQIDMMNLIGAFHNFSNTPERLLAYLTDQGVLSIY